MLIAYVAILCLACLPIYTGSFAALRRPKTAPTASPGEEDEGHLAEKLTSSDALFLPLIGGCVLGSLYLCITYLRKEWVNTILALYFISVGFVSNTQTIAKVLPHISSTFSKLPVYHFTINNNSGSNDKDVLYELPISLLYVISACIAGFLSAYYAFSKNWVVSNIFGLSFAFNGIQLMALDSFATGMILLSGLFLYDIYFVFGTNIMLTVAQGIDAPIKILFPKDILREPFGAATMLGLGDIVIPGVYVALALRYDLSNHHRDYASSTYRKGNHFFEKPYFEAAFTAYIAGLITTIVVMHTFQSAQPALLYLSPACILSTLITAWSRGEMKEVWTYTEESEELLKEDQQRQNSGKLKDI